VASEPLLVHSTEQIREIEVALTWSQMLLYAIAETIRQPHFVDALDRHGINEFFDALRHQMRMIGGE